MVAGQHYSDGGSTTSTPRYDMSVFKTTKPHRSGTCLLLVMVVAACVGPLLVYRYWDITAATAASQQEAVSSLRQLVSELKDLASHLPPPNASTEAAAATAATIASAAAPLDKKWAEMQEQFASMRSDFEKQVQQLKAVQSNMADFTNTVREEMGKDAQSRFSPMDRIGTDPIAINRIDTRGMFLASPSVLKLRTGRMLAVYEKAVTWGMTEDTSYKVVAASDDNGMTWFELARVGPMNWPQIFRCKSGVYVLGTQRHFSHNNNLVISRMLAPDASKWSPPSQLTRGWSVVAANTGVDVSNGRVTKSFELIPSMAEPLTTTKLLKEVTVAIEGGPEGPSWRSQPVVEVEVADTKGFVQYTLVKIPLGARALFFRVLEVVPGAHTLTLRLERFTLYWQQSPVTLPPNTTLQVSSGSNVYGGVDWVAMAMSAEEEADLTRPESWLFADPPLGNPASIYSNEMRALFDVAFRADGQVRKSIIGFDVKELQTDPASAWEAGFGSVYWMEGVITRLQDRHGGNGKLLSLMRVNNDLLCDLAAVLEFDDSQPGRLSGRFLRYTFIPGLGVGHPAILYDPDTDLYWMASNVNRDSTRRWKNPSSPSGWQPSLHITAFSKCEVDRSTLALFYSPNLLNWMMAGVVDYHVTLGRHYTYPHMIVDGSDLVIVTRAAFLPGTRSRTAELNQYYNNHNSNAIALHRIRNFRHFANVEWATEQGAYSQHPRRTSVQEEIDKSAAHFQSHEEAKAQAAASKNDVKERRSRYIEQWRKRMQERGQGRWAAAHLKERQQQAWKDTARAGGAEGEGGSQRGAQEVTATPAQERQQQQEGEQQSQQQQEQAEQQAEAGKVQEGQQQQAQEAGAEEKQQQKQQTDTQDGQQQQQGGSGSGGDSGGQATAPLETQPAQEQQQSADKGNGSTKGGEAVPQQAQQAQQQQQQGQQAALAEGAAAGATPAA